MSAPNFNCHHNSRHLNVFCIWDDFDSYKEDLKTEDPDYYKELQDYFEDPASYAFSEWYDDEKDYYLNFLEESLKEKFGQSVSVKKDHVYDGDSICTISRSFRFAGINFDIKVGIYFEAGYYCGFKLDWDFDSICDYDCMPDLEGAVYLLSDNCWHDNLGYLGLNAGLAKALAPKFLNRFNTELKNLTDLIDDCLDSVAPHKWSGVCLSNGEGIYWEVA